MVANSRYINSASGATKFLRIEREFNLFRGGRLPEVEIAYECWGRLNASADNAILVFTGLSPSAHAASSPGNSERGWWEPMIGTGKPIDTNRYFVICVNSLGSCFGSTGPASINPATGELYRLDFPELSIEDIAVAGREVYRSMGIDRLNTVIGPSLGGMSAIALTVLFPDEVNRLVSISAAANSSPFAIAIRSLQRDIIRSDPLWKNGNYDFDNPPREGIRLARKLGLISYRSAEEFSQRFGRNRILKPEPASAPFAAEFSIESYLEHNAAGFIDKFDTNCYLYLSRALDWFDLHDHGDSIETALAALKTESSLIIGVESDFLFPPGQQLQLHEALVANRLNSRFCSLTSLQGHDAFLIDDERFAPVLADFFNT